MAGVWRAGGGLAVQDGHVNADIFFAEPLEVQAGFLVTGGAGIHAQIPADTGRGLSGDGFVSHASDDVVMDALADLAGIFRVGDQHCGLSRTEIMDRFGYIGFERGGFYIIESFQDTAEGLGILRGIHADPVVFVPEFSAA